MCLICSDKKLTALEGINNLFEMKKEIPEEHFGEVYIALIERLCDEGNIKAGLDMLEKLLVLDCKKTIIEFAKTFNDDDIQKIENAILKGIGTNQ